MGTHNPTTLIFSALGYPDPRESYDELFPKQLRDEFIYPYFKREKRDFLINMYMSKPDYAESHLKLFYSAFLGAKLATFWTACDVLSMKNSRDFKAVYKFAAKNLFFLGGGVLTYGCVATSVANIRGKKDDILNHAIAGASLGFLYGYTHKSSGYGSVFGAVAACAGMLFKQWHLDGRDIFSLWGHIDDYRHYNYMDAENGLIDLRIKSIIPKRELRVDDPEFQTRHFKYNAMKI